MKTSTALEAGAVFSTPPAVVGNKRSKTYIVVAVLSLFVALAGFSVTYFVPLTSGTFTGRGMLHVHGTMYFLWLLVFILQPALVRFGSINLHRRIGIAGFVLAGLMVMMGIAVSVTGARINSPGLAVAGLQPKQFMIIPLTDMLLFTVYLAFSLANLKRFEYHKRLMVLATLSLLPAAFGRITLMLGLTNPGMIMLLTESLLIGVIAYEWITRKKLHPAYQWGGALMILIHFVRFPAASSSWWSSVADWIIL